MQLPASLSKLSSDQISAIKDFEHQLAQQYGNPVVLLAFDKEK
jgi:hypothetical protein